MTLPIARRKHAHDPQDGVDVASVQTRLMRRGFDVGPYGIDGDYGADTERALRQFQRRRGHAVNGVVDVKTWRALNSVATRTTADGTATLAHRRVEGNDGAGRPSYRFGAEVANLNTKHPMSLDCSELVQWAVFQLTGDDWVDGSWNQAAHCRLISTSEAIKTRGALLFLSTNGRTSGVHHVAWSLGNGKTAEARSQFTTPQCGTWDAAGRFSFGGLVPILDY